MNNRPLLLSVPLSLVFLCATFSARADQAADAWTAWNTAFLVQSNGQTYYSGNPVAESPLSNPGGWTGALTIEVAEDAYQRNHTSAQRQLVDDLVTTFLNDSGKTAADWCAAVYNADGHKWRDGWNDDLGWMITAVLHGYQITGNADFLMVAQQTWDCAYARGWDTKYAGGGIWELMDIAGTPSFTKPSKCTLSNNPFIIWGVVLYQITGNASYLTKVEGIYAWVRAHFLDTNTGKVHECWGFNGASDTTGYLQGNDDDHVYDVGTFVQSAEALYRITGDNAYYQDALLVLNHHATTGTILACTNAGACEGNGAEWAYPFVKGLGEFATFNGMWQNYNTWMESNANAAWSKRNALNITWNDWTAATPVYAQNDSANNLSPLDTRGAVGVWQVLPQPIDPTLVGAFELKNVRSGLSLTTGSADDGGIAIVQEPFGGSNDSLWTFVPTSGGYYRIQNVGSGLFLTVESNSGTAGANILGLPMPTFAQGNEQWLPVANEDGSYSFYNLSSVLALDDRAASTSPGTQFDQWFGNGNDAQSFQLIQHTAVSDDAGNGGSSSDGGAANDAGATTLDGGDEYDSSSPPVWGTDAGPAAPSDSSTSGGQDTPSGAASGCGCRTASAAPPTDVFRGLAFFTLGSLGFIRRRRASSMRRMTAMRGRERQPEP